MLSTSIRFQFLFGPCRTPRIKLGAIIEDEIRGEATVAVLTGARIPCLVRQNGRAKSCCDRRWAREQWAAIG